MPWNPFHIQRNKSFETNNENIFDLFSQILQPFCGFLAKLKKFDPAFNANGKLQGSIYLDIYASIQWIQ